MKQPVHPGLRHNLKDAVNEISSSIYYLFMNVRHTLSKGTNRPEHISKKFNGLRKRVYNVAEGVYCSLDFAGVQICRVELLPLRHLSSSS